MSIDLDAIQARADAATRGPWDRFDAQVRPAQIDGFIDPSGQREAQEQAERVIEFIAHARTDVPALLAYARYLEARVGRVEAVTSRNALMDIIADAYGDKNQGHLSLAAADSIRAALTATDAS